MSAEQSIAPDGNSWGRSWSGARCEWPRGRPSRKRPRSSSERLLAVLHAFRHFLHRVGARRDAVFQLNIGVDRPFLLLEKLQHFLDRRLALAPGDIAAVG